MGEDPDFAQVFNFSQAGGSPPALGGYIPSEPCWSTSTSPLGCSKRWPTHLQSDFFLLFSLSNPWLNKSNESFEYKDQPKSFPKIRKYQITVSSIPLLCSGWFHQTAGDHQKGSSTLCQLLLLLFWDDFSVISVQCQDLERGLTTFSSQFIILATMGKAKLFSDHKKRECNKNNYPNGTKYKVSNILTSTWGHWLSRTHCT